MSESFPLLHDPPALTEKRWWRVPVVGWLGSYSRQLQTEHALVSQAVSRGPVPESAWAPYVYNDAVRRTIERIVIDNAFPKGSTFHPLDPVELMFVLRYGDLNEVEILMDVEEKLCFKIDDSLIARLIDDHTTFIDFIHLIERTTGGRSE
ncbi:MAG: hypothetical protein WD716_01215 [Fimbriimonadaceae bacterium]